MTVCIESYKGNGNYCEIEITEGYTNSLLTIRIKYAIIKSPSKRKENLL